MLDSTVWSVSWLVMATDEMVLFVFYWKHKNEIISWGPSRVNYVDEAIADRQAQYRNFNDTPTLITILYFVGFEGSFTSLHCIACFYLLHRFFLFLSGFIFLLICSFPIPIFFPGLFGFRENGIRQCFAGNYWVWRWSPLWSCSRLFHFHTQWAPRCKGNICTPFFVIFFSETFWWTNSLPDVGMLFDGNVPHVTYIVFHGLFLVSALALK